MTCLLITNDFPPIPSGISTQLHQFCRRLPPDRIAVLAPRAEGAEAFDATQPFEVFRGRVPTGGSTFAKALKMLANVRLTLRLQRRHRFTKLHCGQIISPGLACLVCKRLYGTPFTLYVYGSETVRLSPWAPFRWLMRRVLREADAIVANSDFTIAEFVEFGAPREKCVKVTPGVDTDVFRPQAVRPDLLARFRPSGEKILLTVARLDERKGHATMIRALPQVLERVPDVRYVIVGTGREEERLRRLVAELRMEDRVTFAGRVPDADLPHYYNLCDVFVLPNRVTTDSGPQLRGDYEGFGIVFLEANACGKPVIGGRSGGATEAVEDGRSGLLVEPDNADELADAAGRLLTDADLARRLGEYGRGRAVEQFDWRLLAKRIEPLLD